MKTILTIAALFFSLAILNNAKAQSFIFGDWQQGGYYTGNFYNSPPPHPCSITYVGDTVLCGISYSIICRLPAWPGPIYCATYNYVRKLSGKIFTGGDCGYPDILMYDFNLLVNDTITLNYGYGHTGLYQVDTTYNVTLLNSTSRKYMELRGIDNWNSWDTLHWIEDIGDIDNGFFPEADFEGGESYFICHKENSQLLWENTINQQTIMSCDSVTTLILSTTNIPTQDIFDVFPNPFENSISIHSYNGGVFTIILYDITLRNIHSDNFEKNITLDTSTLEEGVYIFQIKKNSRIIKSGKIVKR